MHLLGSFHLQRIQFLHSSIHRAAIRYIDEAQKVLSKAAFPEATLHFPKCYKLEQEEWCSVSFVVSQQICQHRYAGWSELFLTPQIEVIPADIQSHTKTCLTYILCVQTQPLCEAAVVLQINISACERRAGMYEVLRVTLSPFLLRAESLDGRQ